jgi:hypothetical protein
MHVAGSYKEKQKMATVEDMLWPLLQCPPMLKEMFLDSNIG